MQKELENDGKIKDSAISIESRLDETVIPLEDQVKDIEIEDGVDDKDDQIENQEPPIESKEHGKSECQEKVIKENLTNEPGPDQEAKEKEISGGQEAALVEPQPESCGEPPSPKGEIEVKTFNFDVTEVKMIERNGMSLGVVSGYGSTFNNVDRGQDRVMPGAFKKSIQRHQDSQRPVRMYYQHNSQEIIGGFPAMQLREDAKGLFVVGEINLGVQRGREVFALAKQGVLTDFSIGYTVRDFDLKAGVRELKEIELWEVSVVSEPMNPLATITEVKQSLKTKRDVERNLRDSGLSRSHAALIASLVDESKLNNDSVDYAGDVGLTEEKVELIGESPIDSNDNLKTRDLLRQASELIFNLTGK